MTFTVEFLHTPSEFHSRLLTLIHSATKRVSLATLYVGSGGLERQLLDTIQMLPSGVQVTFLVDGLRGNRKEQKSPINFIRSHCPRAEIREYVSRRYAGLARLLPDRIREIVGTQHMKIVVVDDTVMITGANLSEIYFTNRQDRYMVIAGCSKLANELHRIVSGETSASRNTVRHFGDEDTRLSFAIHAEGERDELVHSLLRKTPADSTIHLSSPYLNFSPEILLALRKFSHVKIITGSIESNGFHSSKGISKFIPEAYEVVKNEVRGEFELYEYTRQGWTFHPKGIWVTPAGSELPIATIVGSSNFSHRSLIRDLEISFSLETNDTNIRMKMQNELREIIKHVRPGNARRKTRSFIRYLVKGPLRNFL